MEDTQFYTTDVVIVGGGIAGAAAAAVLARSGIHVTLLERQQKHTDLVRGEVLMPWGVAELIRLELLDCAYAAGAWSLRWWRQWDETAPLSQAPVIDLADHLVPGVEGPLSFSHPALCASLCAMARAGGADVVCGAQRVLISAGPKPVVSCVTGGRRREYRCRLVLGAGGRYGQNGRQIGAVTRSLCHHWGGGLAVTGLREWPDDTQALGTEGDVTFYVFPQGGGRARLYLYYAAGSQHRFTGPDKVHNFLNAFNVTCVPWGADLASATPTARLACFPSAATWVDPIVTDGAVLIGDAAGANDPVLGTGVSNSLRDARLVAEIMISSRDWSPAAFAPYVAERDARMRRVHACASIMARLYAEYGDLARARRRRAIELMAGNPAYARFLYVAAAGPEDMPGERFADYLSDRLLAVS